MAGYASFRLVQLHLTRKPYETLNKVEIYKSKLTRAGEAAHLPQSHGPFSLPMWPPSVRGFPSSRIP